MVCLIIFFGIPANRRRPSSSVAPEEHIDLASKIVADMPSETMPH